MWTLRPIRRGRRRRLRGWTRESGRGGSASGTPAAAASTPFAGRRSAIILCGRLGCANEVLSFGEEGRGKPVALLSGNPAPVSFSVSHSGIHGLIAVATAGRLGVDVEARVARRDLDALMAAVLTPDERAEIEAAGAGERLGRFYGLWTIKEALVKALGTGLQLDPAGFAVPAAMRRGVTTGEFRFPHLPAVTWRVENLGNEHFAAAVAHERVPRSKLRWAVRWHRSSADALRPGIEVPVRRERRRPTDDRGGPTAAGPGGKGRAARDGGRHSPRQTALTADGPVPASGSGVEPTGTRRCPGTPGERQPASAARRARSSVFSTFP